MQLEIRNLSKAYANGVQALKDVTLTIPVGVYGLLGPKGAGKSTLLRILATVLGADKGGVRLGNLNLLAHRDEARKALGYLPQEPDIHPNVSAEALLDHFALLRGITRHWQRRETLEALLRQVSLWEVRKQRLGGYSAGMRQRFAVAVALLGHPRLLICDEPTAGLDSAERVGLLHLLGELGENRIVILSTRSADDVSERCTRMALIDRGEIVFEAESLHAPRSAVDA